MKTTIVIILAQFWVLSAFAQITFKKRFGLSDVDLGFSVEQTTDGGYILLGLTDGNGNGNNDMYLIKTDAFGEELWHRTYGSPGWEFATSVQQTSDGGYVLCGSYSGLGEDTLVIIKTDSEGNEIWNNRYNGVGDRDVGQFVQETSDGGFVAVGFTGVDFEEDVYLVKTNSSGTELWSKVFYEPGRSSGSEIRQTPDDGYIIIGTTENTVNGAADFLLIKTNSSGDTLWTRTYGTSAHETGSSIFLTSDGGYILLGYKEFGSYDIYLIKTDGGGNEQWHSYYGSTAAEMGYSVQQTGDGGYIIAGRQEDVASATTHMYCLKTNSIGIVEWEHVYPEGYFSEAFSVDQTSDGGYIMLGHVIEIDSVFQADMYLVKIDALGNLNNNPGSSGQGVSIFPNPFLENCTIFFQNSGTGDLTFDIINSLGQIVRSVENIRGNYFNLKRESLGAGMYFLRIRQGNNIIDTIKLIAR